ncbi:VWA domain-containing protein [Thermodesulfobacteriota bacterium]
MFCFIALWSMAPSVWAQPIEQLTINYIETSPLLDRYANQVRAYVTVSAADESPILGLSTENFKLFEDGKKIDIEEASQTSDPMSVVLAIDTSGSMLAKDKSGLTSMAAAKKAAANFIQMLSAGDQIAIYSFNNDSTLHMDFSANHEAAVNAVNRLKAKPNAATLLYDTAIEAVKKTAEIPKGRRAVILLTDGKDEKAGKKYSVHNVNDVIDMATTKAIRVPVYTIGVGPKVDAKALGRISNLTGGRNLLATSLADLPVFYQTIAHQLKNQYEIKYITRTPSGEHSLVVKAVYEDSTGHDERRFWAPPLPVLQPPTIAFISPDTQDTIRDAVTVELRITPLESVTKVRFYQDASLKKEITSPPFNRFEWNTAGLSPGLHIIRAEAVNATGQIGSAEMTLKVTVPTLAFISPRMNDQISGMFSVNMRIQSEEGLAKVSYYIDNNLIKEITSPPFENVSWNSADLSAGPHVLRVEAVDTKKQIGTAQTTINVTIPAAIDVSKPNVLVLIIGGVFILLAIAGGGIWWFGFRKKDAAEKVVPLREETRTETGGDFEDSDETIFIPDVGIEKMLPPAATLRVLECPGIETGKSFDLIGSTKIGRDEKNAITIAEKSVSRKHSEIYFDGSNYCIRDLGSKFSTKVDQHRVSSEVFKLTDGAKISLGPKVLFQFHCTAAAAASLEDEATQQYPIEVSDDDEATKEYPLGNQDSADEDIDELEATMRVEDLNLDDNEQTQKIK